MFTFRRTNRNNTPKCFEYRPDVRVAPCPRLARPSFVCHGWEKERECPLRKKFYIATVAQTECDSERSLSRSGVHPDEETIARMDEALTPCVRNGQSPMAVKMANPNLFGKYAKSTLYERIASGQ